MNIPLNNYAIYHYEYICFFNCRIVTVCVKDHGISNCNIAQTVYMVL